jgi:alkylation response protein AidB-like acyl-CoA dehydrogenase
MDPKLLKGVNTELFGDGHPFSDPSWYQAQNSPFYNDTHRALRKKLRDFTDEHVTPNCYDWDEAGSIPREVYQMFGETKIMPLVLGRPWPEKYIGPCPLGFEPDYFHELITYDELARCGSGGFMWGIAGGMTIGLPPVYNYATEEIKQKVLPPVLMGDKIICLAITEPTAGSDVANVKSSAEDKGDHYLLNGEKKWITNGVFADYFTVLCRTGGKGMKGLSMLLVEKNMEGVNTRKMKCSGVWSSGTTYITFEDVKVPKGNLIGKEGKGFKIAMANFNHERFALCAMTNRFSRVCLEEALKFSLKRKTFGKPLMEHPVIRWKLAEMARAIESTHAWLENITFQMNTMTKLEATYKLGGSTALLKVQCTKVFEYCAREAAQVFGGLGYTRGGQGEKVERLSREVRAMAVPGGSEEIMIDLGIRQTTKLAEMAKALMEQMGGNDPQMQSPPTAKL